MVSTGALNWNGTRRMMNVSTIQPISMVLTGALNWNGTRPKITRNPKAGNSYPHGFIVTSSQLNISRRKVSSVITTSSLTFLILRSGESAANAESPFDFLRMTVPDQTVEEAEAGIREHASTLLQVKQLLEIGSWKEAQKELRKSSALLKQDIYTIIQAKPGIQRPALRELYSKLFNSVTGLDFAARDKDLTRVWECYSNILLALDHFFSAI